MPEEGQEKTEGNIGGENMPIPESGPIVSTGELPQSAKQELKPIAGGAPWLYTDQSELDALTSPELKRIIGVLETTPPNLLTAELLSARFLQIQDLIIDEKVDSTEAQDYLIKINQRVGEIRTQEAEQEEERATRLEEAFSRATTQAYKESDFRRDDLSWQQRWLRSKIQPLESREVSFDSRENLPFYGPIMAHYPELLPEVRAEWEARRVLHDFAFFFEQQGIFNPRIADTAVAVTNEHLNVLLKLPGVAEAFREYERRAYSDDPSENILVGDREEVMRKWIAIAQIARGARQPDEIEEEWNARGQAAQRIAEHIWRITGRAALWTRLLPKNLQKLGNGVRGPCEVFLRRVYNFEAWAEDHGARPEMLGRKEMPSYADLHFLDFWSQMPAKFLAEYGLYKEQFMARGEAAFTTYLGSMENAPLESMDILSLFEGVYGAYMGDFVDANETRGVFLGFLRTPTPKTLLEAAARFGHLSPEEDEEKKIRIDGREVFEKTSQRAVCERLLKGLIWFRRHYAKSVFKETNWNSDNIANSVRGVQSVNLITKEQAEKVLREELGPRVVGELRQQSTRIDWGEAAWRPVATFLKAIFGGIFK